MSARRWRVDAGGEYSTFSRRTVPAWNQQFVQVARRIDAADGLSGPMAVHGRVERFERYDLTDWALEAGVYREFFPRLRGMFAGGWSPDAVFRPQWRLAADAEYLLRASTARGGALPAVWGLAGARYDVYQAAEFLGLLPGARLEWGPWAVTGQMSHVSEVGADALTGWSLRFDGLTGSPRLGPLREGARFLAGVADSPETEARGANAVTISTFTVFAGLALDFDGDWTLHLGYSRDDRESSWIRHAFTAGVARAF